MSNRTKIVAAAAFLAVAVAAIPGFASAQAPSATWSAAYNAGSPGPYRPYGQARAQLLGGHAMPPVEYGTGAYGLYQGSAGAAYQLGGAQ